MFFGLILGNQFAGQVGESIPANALLDEDGNPIRDEDGNIILIEE